MKRVLFALAGLLYAATVAFAQPAAPTQPLTLAASLNRGYNAVKQNLTEEAEKMPEVNYGFKPGPAPELRNFGQLFAHVASSQFGSCSAALGQRERRDGSQHR